MAGQEVAYPKGLRVLVVDDNPTCLKILQKLLRKCSYTVSITTEAATGLKMLSESDGQYDIVISDVHMPKMDGFDLLQRIGFHYDIPVIMLSANDNPKQVLRGVTSGAVDYLLKPVRIEELKNIWQHVVRRKREIQREKASKTEKDVIAAPVGVEVEDVNSNLEDSLQKKRKDQIYSDEFDEGYEGGNDETEASSSQKKPRVIWSPELHKLFVAAVEQLGPDRAFPKKILDTMNVDGLTRENVASHLQKYRIYLKRLNNNDESNENANASSIPYGIQSSSSIYLSGGGSMLSTYGAIPSYTNGVGNSQTGLLGQMSNNTTLIGSSSSCPQVRDRFPTDLRLQNSVPCLSEYNRRLENWQNSGPSQQQRPNNGVNSADVAQLQYALERNFTMDSPTQRPPMTIAPPMNNHTYNILESNTLPVEQPSSRDDYFDSLMGLDDHYFLGDSSLLDEFIESDGCLLDIISKFPKLP